MIDRINGFFNSVKNIGLAIIVWAIIAFGLLEFGGCVYVNFFQGTPNALIDPPPIEKARYEVYVEANRRFLYSNDVTQVGSIVNLDGYWFLDGDKFRYNKLPLALDEIYFGNIEVTRR